MGQRRKEPTIEDVRLLTAEEVASLLGVSVQTLKAWRNRRKGPTYYRMGKEVRYKLADLIRWQRANLVEVAPSA